MSGFINHFYMMSGLTVGSFVVDKAAQVFGLPPLPAVTLHTLELFGGSLASFVCQRMLRHKTSSTEYQLYFFAILAMQHAISLLALVAMLGAGVHEAHGDGFQGMTPSSVYDAVVATSQTEAVKQLFGLIIGLSGCLAFTIIGMVRLGKSKQEVAATATVKVGKEKGKGKAPVKGEKGNAAAQQEGGKAPKKEVKKDK